ncbi:exodeoxyribonuclease VII large subunit [Dermatophilaceae bacterium Soc4.6]
MTTPPARRPLPERAADTNAEEPWPLRMLSLKIADYVDKMSVVWVEGQVVQLSTRGTMAYLTLRDADVDMSINVSISMNSLRAMPPLAEGARVVVQAKASFWTKRGSLSLDARQIRPVGVGDLLARVEQLGRMLQQEGLFDAGRKRPLPFLPRKVGLVTGRESAAERDVVENARRRWPSVEFEVREVAVQGVTAVTEVTAALRELDADRTVDVIVIARGGGSAEELLPFSNETLLRAVAAAVTPVVSAIGHEVDRPLLDLVADWRASTPTDAGKRVVPDAEEERARIEGLLSRAGRALTGRLTHERHRVEALVSRPAIADPGALVRRHRDDVVRLRERGSERVLVRLRRAHDQIGHLGAQVRALSPQSTLERGYAVVQHPDGRLVLDQTELAPDQLLRVRVARGDFGVRTVGTPTPPSARSRTAPRVDV